MIRLFLYTLYSKKKPLPTLERCQRSTCKCVEKLSTFPGISLSAINAERLKYEHCLALNKKKINIIQYRPR